MNPFTFVSASDVSGALWLAGEGTRFIAGGTNLIDLMKVSVLRPARLVLHRPREMDESAERTLPYHRSLNRDALAAHQGRFDLPFGAAVVARRALEQLAGRRHRLAEMRAGQGIHRILETEPRQIGHRAGGVEGRAVHFPEPIHRTRQHHTASAWKGRRVAKFTNCHGTRPSAFCCGAT